jgi:anti-sigma factor RsiW
MIHLTDELLNEYLDHELADRAPVENHLAVCADCAARLAALQTLFTELESLPELTLTHTFAARFTRTLRQAKGDASNLPAPLPRSLRLTVILQTVAAVVALVFAAPFVTEFVAPVLATLQLPSFTEVLIQIQTQWMTWLDTLSQLQLPTLPEIPVVEFSSLVIMLTLAGASTLWLVGNGLLLRNQIK